MESKKKLIDANALKSRLNELEASGGHKYYRQGMNDTLHKFMPRILDDAPTVDAVEVVHGRWVKKTADYVYYYACSECGEPVLKGQWGNDFFSDYCPNCGAKMDGDGNGSAQV